MRSSVAGGIKSLLSLFFDMPFPGVSTVAMKGCVAIVRPRHRKSQTMNPNNPLFQTLTLALPMIAIFYFLLWRPQSQRAKQLRAMVDGLRRGDTVVTSGGILGKVVKASNNDDPEILIEIQAVCAL